MDGSFVLMDIAAAQLAFDRLGRVDRMDLQLTSADGSGSGPATIDAARGRDQRAAAATGCRAGGRRGAASRWSGCWPRFT